MEKQFQWERVSTEASLMPKFQPKIMFYAVLNWKRVQFSESHQFWGIWTKISIFEIPLALIKVFQKNEIDG
jgi:hypothetical protein